MIKYTRGDKIMWDKLPNDQKILYKDKVITKNIIINNINKTYTIVLLIISPLL